MDFISVECLEKLGLEQNPFIDHARDPFLFVDKQLEMSMNVLVDYLLNQNSTLVLLGEVGIGKTTHLRMLLRKGYQKFNFCTLRAKSNTTLADIEKKIKERWRLPYQDEKDVDKAEDLTTNEHIKEYIEDDKFPVLIIDDAHRLNLGVLDELLKLKHHVGLQSSRAMGLVLASEPGMQSQLAELEQTNPAATQIYQVNVRAFDANQCEEYLRYRLEQAGAADEGVFSASKITEIYTKSKGLPKHINRLAREELAHQCEQPASAITTVGKLQSSPGMRLGLILAGLIGLAVIITALVKNTNPTDEPIALDISKPETEKDIAHEPNEKNESDKTLVVKDDPKQKLASNNILKPYVAPLVLGPLRQEELTEKIENKESTDKKSLAETTTEPKTEQKDASQINQKNNYSSDWILKQDPMAYTIQIVASASEKNLLDFINKNNLTENTAYYKKTSADKAWYVLVHGSYPSREDALKNIESLSAELKKNTPYPIQMKYLQEIIRTP